MNEQLVKREDRYDLYDSDGHKIASTLDGAGNKLSLKNCLSIERGYDLEELAKTEYPIGEVWNEEEALIRELAFKKGFQKALELMGDKKFSEEQLREAFLHVQNEPTFDVFKQSLQQNEWDVEIETVPALSNNGNVYYGDIPKLDDEGCLILKKYKNG